MRIAFMADIHGNLQALEAVIKKMNMIGPLDMVLVAGDIVGYGANPKECIQVIKDISSFVCMGNHDAAVCDMISSDTFNNDAREAVEWTKSILTQEEIHWLSSLPLIVTLDSIGWTMVHGSLEDPGMFLYVMTYEDAIECFAKLETRFCLIGHTHTPMIVYQENENSVPSGKYAKEGKFDLPQKQEKVIFNTGSVGQPRDEDSRACFAVYDSDKKEVNVIRVSYDIDEATRRILNKGLPESLGIRLYKGW